MTIAVCRYNDNHEILKLEIGLGSGLRASIKISLITILTFYFASASKLSDDSLVLLEPHHCVTVDVMQASHTVTELRLRAVMYDVFHCLTRRVAMLADWSRSHSPFVEHLSSAAMVAPDSVEGRPLTSRQGETWDFSSGVKDQFFVRELSLVPPTFSPLDTDIDLFRLQTRPYWGAGC